MSDHCHWSILLTPTKGGVLQDMGHTSVIWRVCFKPDGEDIVLVIPSNMEILCSSPVMLQVKSCKLQLWHMLRTFQCKAMNIFAWPGILVEVCHRGKTSSVQGLMDTLANLPSRVSTVRLQDPPRRHSQHIKNSLLLIVAHVARQILYTAQRQLLVSSRSWQ